MSDSFCHLFAMPGGEGKQQGSREIQMGKGGVEGDSKGRGSEHKR